jgi:predicted DNA-binding transcriptional regulator YafY
LSDKIPRPLVIERELDGALTVRFLAGGVQEMCWHLFTWGTAVTIVAPEELRAELAGLAAAASAHHRERHDKVERILLKREHVDTIRRGIA